METLLIDDGGAVTIPPLVCDKLGLDKLGSSFFTFERREDGIFLRPMHPNELPLREFSQETIDRWRALDEADMAAFRAGEAVK